jgi:hypothetical protein
VNEEREEERRESSASDLKIFLWHDGSVYDGWFYASFVVIGYLSQFFNFWFHILLIVGCIVVWCICTKRG